MHYRVWYTRPKFFSFGLLGAQGLREIGKLPSGPDLTNTHVFLKKIEAPDKQRAFVAMQAENWSPNGEARALIKARGLAHTSMSVGDVLVEEETGTVLLVDQIGFAVLEGSAPITEV